MTYVIGADLGGTKLSAVLRSTAGEVIHRVWENHQTGDYPGILQIVMDVVDQCRTIADSQGVRVAALGLSVAGWFSRDRSELIWGANIAARGARIREDLENILGLPVVIENDGNATALAEQRVGAGRGARVLALFTLGTGSGGGVIVDGHPLTGGSGVGGELGHISIDPSGPHCVCGGVGCVELYTSGRGLVRRYGQLRAAGSSSAPALDRAAGIVAAALDGQPLAAAIVHAAGMALARAIQIIVPVLDPDLILVGGTVGHSAGPLLLPVIRAELARQHPLQAVSPTVPVELAELGPEAGALGAAELAADLLSPRH